MKGTLVKTDQGWVVEYWLDERTPIGPKYWWEKLPLHPDFIEMMDTCFTSKFTHEIDFEVLTEWENGEVGVNGLTYAKPIHHPGDTNEMIDHVGEVNEMVNHVPDVRKMVEDDIEKLAEKYPYGGREGSKRLAFIDGYNTAKETLYTEEQVMEAMLQISEYYADNIGKNIDGNKKALEIIQSLKQPKQ